jgi:hypothetical protein
VEDSWVKSVLDSLCRSYLKRWAKIPSNGVNDYFLFDPRGHDLLTLYDIYRLERASKYLQMKRSRDEIILKIIAQDATHTKKRYKQPWSPRESIENATNKLIREKDLSAKTPKVQHEMIMRELKENFQREAKDIAWKKAKVTMALMEDLYVCESLMDTKFRSVFDRLSPDEKYYYESVFMGFTMCNARRNKFGYSCHGKCPLCGNEKQTNNHIISACPYSAGDNGKAFNRYLFRHNNVLTAFLEGIEVHANGWKLYVDLPDSKYYCTEVHKELGLSEKLKPDLVLTRIAKDKATKELYEEIHILELTVPLTRNVEARAAEKMKKYENWIKNLGQGRRAVVHTFEIAADTGFASKTLFEAMLPLRIPKLIKKAISQEMSVEAVKASAKIWRCRNSHSFEKETGVFEVSQSNRTE